MAKKPDKVQQPTDNTLTIAELRAKRTEAAKQIHKILIDLEDASQMSVEAVMLSYQETGRVTSQRTRVTDVEVKLGF